MVRCLHRGKSPTNAGRMLALGAAVTLLALVTGDPSSARIASRGTPIRHVIVIFQENISFDHYFATYPHAANTDGTAFRSRSGTPSVNGLGDSLLAPNNPNSVQPFRLSHEQAQTCDQDHGYTNEQRAFDGGLMDRFVESVGRGDGGTCPDYGKGAGLVMGYYDGNTVTALWNYAQKFAMSDNSYDTTFGPSTPGALNLVSGQTHGFAETSPAVTTNGTVIGDPQPTGDICDTRDTSRSIDPRNKNIGELLNARGITWGWFQGGFRDCSESHATKGGVMSKDYIPHHEPFQFYASTANLNHLAPSSVKMIGKTDRANHQYDLTDFWVSVHAGNLPAVSYLKAAAYQDGHAGYSDPLDEQDFLVSTINRLQRTRFWRNTAVIIAYDDSDGWYDHQMGPTVNQSQDPRNDALTGPSCGTKPEKTLGGYQDRCGYGPRLPLLVISPWARSNFVDHSVSDQTSILRFVEDNWQIGRIGNFSFDSKAGSLLRMFNFAHRRGGPSKLFLDPLTGARR